VPRTPYPCYDPNLTNCQESLFTGTIGKSKQGVKGIKVIYQLNSTLHAQTEPFGADSIKYKFAPFASSIRYGTGRSKERVILGSPTTAIQTRRTCPSAKLESEEYKF
jgi:hypothetical protein